MPIPPLEVEVKLNDKWFDKQVDAKILEVEKKFASIWKTSSIAPNIDSTKLKNQANSLRVDLAKKIKEIEKELELEPTIDSKQINDDLKDVRQDISAFNDRVNSDEAKTYAQRLSQIKAVKKELTALKRIAEKTWEKTIADELWAKLEIVSKKVTQANAELTNFVKTWENNVSVLWKLFNNVTKEIEESRNELKKLWASTKQLDKLERSIESINKDFKAWKITAKQYAQWLESIKESSRKATQQSQWLKNALTKVASAAAWFAVFSKAKDYVIEMDWAMTKLAISTGGTQKELDSFKDSARNLQSEWFWDFNKNIESLSQVQRQLKLTWEEAEKVAKTGLLIDQWFGISSKESIDALDKAMKGFWVSSQEASDILINWLQNSWDASGDFIDTVREYSSQIWEAWWSFQQFVNKILVAEELWIRNTDQFADLYRESIIRVKDASDKTKEGFKDLWLSYDDFVQWLSDWTITVEEQIGIISNKILEIEDPIIQNQIATDLLGTKFEDNGIVAVEALASIQNKLPELEWATDRAWLVVEQSLWWRWAKLKWQILPILESIGLSLVNFILNITNTISVTFNGLTKTIPNAVKSMMDFVATNFSNGWNNIIWNTIWSLKSIVSNVEMFLWWLWTKAIQWGWNIVSSFVNWIKNQFPLLTSVVWSAAKIVTDFLAVFSPTNKWPLAQDQSIWWKNLISEINKGILSKKWETEKVMKEIADTIWKPIDAPEVSEIFNKLKQQEDNLIKEEEKREKLRQSLVKEWQEKRRKESEKTFQELEKSQDKIQDSIKKTREEYWKLREETEKLKDEALETIRGLNNEINNLDKWEGEDLADRALDLEEERAKILEKISNEKIKHLKL